MTSRRASPKKKRSKRPDKPRTRQISNWLDFIRLRLELYVTLPRGDQKKYVERLSEQIRESRVDNGDRPEAPGPSVNTLRRYMAAAQFLESHGIVKFRPDRPAYRPLRSRRSRASASGIPPTRKLFSPICWPDGRQSAGCGPNWRICRSRVCRQIRISGNSPTRSCGKHSANSSADYSASRLPTSRCRRAAWKMFRRNSRSRTRAGSTC